MTDNRKIKSSHKESSEKYWHKIACIFGALFGFSFAALISILIILCTTKI